MDTKKIIVPDKKEVGEIHRPKFNREEVMCPLTKDVQDTLYIWSATG